MMKIKFYSEAILLILLSIIIYCLLFIVFYFLAISNEMIISFINKINIFIQPRPNFLLMDDISKIILPTVFILDSIFCGFIIFILKKMIKKNIPEILEQIKNYLIWISIIVILFFFINYVKSYVENKKIINKYHRISYNCL